MQALSASMQRSSCLGTQRRAQASCWPGVHGFSARPVAKGTGLWSQRTSRDSPLRLRTATLDAPTGTAEPSKQHASPATATQHERVGSNYSWTKQWWPVFPVFQLDKQKPHPVTLLGKDYVVWWDKAASNWSVLEDRCPHRLAQLSLGRIVGDQLMCSYHGWQFNGKGSCVSIPQIGDARAAESALSSSRTCVSSFPTRMEDGLLFAWLDSSPNAAAEAKAEKTMISEHVAGDAAISPTWIANTVPNDYIFWLEQGMDPSHAPFLHHGLAGFSMEGAVPLEGDAVPIGSSIDINKGFHWVHGAFDLNTAQMAATREFMAPHSIITQYVKPPKPGDKSGRNNYTHFQTFVVPVSPGVCRTFFKFGAGKHRDSGPNKAAGIISKLPSGLLHVLLNSQSRLGDQDITIMNGQETSMRKSHLTRRDYNLFARADEGLKALHEWFKMADYEQMWEERQPGGVAAWQTKSLEQQLSRWDRHTKDCVVCQKEYGRLTKFCTMLGAIGIALGAAAPALIAASHGADLRAVAIAAVSGLCLLARGKVAEWRDTCLLSSAKQWRGVGGLSLVKGVPIQL